MAHTLRQGETLLLCRRDTHHTFLINDSTQKRSWLEYFSHIKRLIWVCLLAPNSPPFIAFSIPRQFSPRRQYKQLRTGCRSKALCLKSTVLNWCFPFPIMTVICWCYKNMSGLITDIGTVPALNLFPCCQRSTK